MSDEHKPQAPRANVALINLELERLAGIDDTQYELERREAAQELGVSLAFLDRRRTALRKEKGEDGPPPAVEELEAWEEDVDGAALAELIRRRIMAHVVFAEATDADAVTLWIFGSYLMGSWRLWPKLLVSSPTKRCGKSTLLEVIEAFSCRAMVATNTSAAALYRSIAKWEPTLILDECDTYFKLNPELAGIANGGHLRRTAWVQRCVEVGGQQDVARFSVWCPQVLAGIGSMADTLTDRSVRIELRRKLAHESIERLHPDFFEKMRPMRRKLMRWCEDHANEIGESEAEPPESGNDRRRDNWTPLYRIAQALGGAWPDRALAAYAAAARSDDGDTEPAGVRLLSDMMAVFERRGAERLPTREIVASLIEMEERPWSEWSKGRPLTAHQMARLLRPFGVTSRNVRTAGEQLKGFDLAELRTVHARYSPSPPQSDRPIRPSIENTEENGAANRPTNRPTVRPTRTKRTTTTQTKKVGRIEDGTDGGTDSGTDRTPEKHNENNAGTDGTLCTPPLREKEQREHEEDDGGMWGPDLTPLRPEGDR